MRHILGLALVFACIAAVFAPANAALIGGQTGSEVRGFILIRGVTPPLGKTQAFDDWARKNAAKYAACSDMVVAVQMGDGSVFKQHPTGDINTGKCSFDVHVSDTKSFVVSVALSNLQGVLIGLFQPAAKGGGGGTHEHELIEFSFRKIEFEQKIGKTIAMDDWHQ